MNYTRFMNFDIILQSLSNLIILTLPQNTGVRHQMLANNLKDFKPATFDLVPHWYYDRLKLTFN